MRPGSRIEKRSKRLFWSLAGAGLKPGDPGPFRFHDSPSILLLRPDRLGDFLLSVPAFQALERAGKGHARLTFVVGTRNEAMARFFFPQARILVFRKFFLARLWLFLRLWTGHFDLTIDFHSFPFSTTSALMTLLSGSPTRVGFQAEGEFAELSRKVFNRGVKAPPSHLHESRKGFQLLGPILGSKPLPIVLRLPDTPQAAKDRVEEFYRRTGAGRRDPVLAIHPTLEKADNRWSQEHYLALVRAAVRPGVRILVVHGKGEGKNLEIFERGLANLPNVFILPEDDLLFILEASKRFSLFVCNDSGLMHLVALAAPVLALFGPSDPRQWGPLGLGSRHAGAKVLRKKDRLCDSITPGEVLGEIRRRIRSFR